MASTVQQQYNRLATIYDRRWRSYITRTLSFLRDWGQIQPSEDVLDVACGTGELERLLVQQYAQQSIVGIDFSEPMLAIARAKLHDFPRVRFHDAIASDLPWRSPQFDVVICANAFHYFDHPHTVLTEMRRVLNPNGRVIILDWCRDFWACQCCDWVLGWTDPGHNRCYTQAELHALLQAAGYTLRRSRRVRFGLVWGLMAADASVS